MRRVLLGLILGVLIAAPLGYGASKLVSNPMTSDLDAAGHAILLNGGQIQGPGVIGNLDVLNTAALDLRSDNPVQLSSGSADPSTGAGVDAPIGSLYVRSDQAVGIAQLWQKTGAVATDWTQRF